MKKKIRNPWGVALYMMACACLFLQTAQAESKTVKAAFLPEMYGFYVIQENGDYSGYNYDYLMNVVQHTNWNLEFVVIEEGTVSQSLAKAEEMMIAGELDLVGPYSGTSARFDDFETGERNYGVYRYNYYSLLNNYAISQDNYFLQDVLTVGMVEYYADLNEDLFRLMDVFGIEIQPVYVQSHSEMIDLLLNEEVDTIINLDMSSHAEYLDFLTTVQRIPFYFASTKGNSELMAELDDAIGKIEIIEPDIHQRLLATYFGVQYAGDFTLLNEEQSLLSQQDCFKVGFLSDVPPYQFIDQEGECTGISVEFIGKLEEIMGVPFEIYWYDTLEEISYALKSQEIDLVGTLSNNYRLAHSLDVTLTLPYISSGVYWLRSVNEVANPKPLYHYVSDSIPFYSNEELSIAWDIKATLDEMEKSGTVSVICDPYITDYYLSLYAYHNIEVQAVSHVLNELTFGVGSHIDENTIGLINRAINYVDTYELDEIIFRNTSVNTEYTMTDFLRAHAPKILAVLVVIALTLIWFFYNNSIRFKELSRRDGLTGLYNAGYFHSYAESKIPHLGSGTLIIVDIDYFKNVNDNFGHQKGDDTIKAVAEILKSHFRTDDIVARLGGDEFVALLGHSVEKEELERRSQEILEELSHPDKAVPVTLSIGGYSFSSSTSYSELYKKADDVLYQVKEKGRNGFLFQKQS